MPADVHRKVYCLPKFTKRNYHALMKTIYNSHTFEVSDVAQYRHHVLQFFAKHGIDATLDAFEVKRSSVYNWKRAYEASDKRLVSLVPKSTRPHKTRFMVVDPKVNTFIKSLREQHGLDKYKVKLFLDAYATEHNLPTYGATKIGQIIKRNHYFFAGKAIKRPKRRLTSARRTKYAPKETVPGYVQMDSFVVYVAGQRICFSCVIDVVTKYAYCAVVPSLAATHALTTLQAFIDQYPYAIRVVQTDNGSEFLGVFHAFLEQQGIDHLFSYPHSPKTNSTVERFNRIVQDECVNRSDELWYDLPRFTKKLSDFVAWYNTQRPHHSLKLQSPLQYMQQFS